MLRIRTGKEEGEDFRPGGIRRMPLYLSRHVQKESQRAARRRKSNHELVR